MGPSLRVRRCGLSRKGGFEGQQVCPALFFGEGLTQQIGWMVDDVHGHGRIHIFVFIAEYLAAQAGDAAGFIQHGFGGSAADEGEHFGVYEGNMFFHEGAADLQFICRGLAVAGGAPEKGVGDIEIFGTGEADEAEHAIQQLAAWAAEGNAVAVLLRAGGFADEHGAAFGYALCKHGVGGGAFEGAAFEVANGFFQLFEGGGCIRKGAGGLYGFGDGAAECWGFRGFRDWGLGIGGWCACGGGCLGKCGRTQGGKGNGGVFHA